MEIRPSESPIYGGVPIELEFSVELCPEAEHNLPHAFYLVFEGSRARHVCRAQLIHQSNNGRLLLLTTAPPHDRVEETKLRAFYRGHLGTRPVLFHTTQFQFVSDAAYQVASTLIRTQLSNTSSLILERVIKGRLELRTQMHCLRRVDRRLAAAFRAIQKPERWTIAPLATTNRTSNNNNNKDESETLLHLASRMGLSELCEYLLCCPGSLVALKTPNSQGSLPQDLARQNGYDKLSEKLANYRSSSCVKSENPLLYDCVISEGRDHCLPPTITTNLLSDHQPDEVSDIDRLEELIASVERVVSPMPLMSYGAAVGAANDFNINYPTSTTIEQSSQTGVSQEAHRKQQNSVNGNADGQMCQDGDTSGSQQITQALGHIEDNHAAQDSKKEVRHMSWLDARNTFTHTVTIAFMIVACLPLGCSAAAFQAGANR
ncbi:rho guanine nucleotide exchange factor 28-like isoform X2 [Varroa jacobsoni]|uniref:rho guanine nucleotide exchange factor 28-like isoform X2 n=1 Tax=Varroa jacobsoni TaxID=62625 RepID=UPI000BF2A850|nr:rho guanine nucleotide exchange factor 28-like isoform X2 [Varroa jacobsoni]